MGSFSRAARIWISIVAVAACAATAFDVFQFRAAAADWLPLALLAGCAAISHFFPVRSGSDGASYRLTTVFVIAGSVILPRELLTPLVILAIAPDLWTRRHRPKARLLVGSLFNISQTALAAHAGSAVVTWVTELRNGIPSEVLELAGLIAGAAVFTLVQELLVGVIVALDQKIPLTRVSTFTMPALLSNSLIAVLGITVAGLWLARPVLLLLLPPVLFLAHRMTRTAHMARMAEVDGKTGLHNYLYFERALEEELSHSLRSGRTFSLLFADLDHFKKVNDTHGHAAGDVVLRDLSTVITGLVRKDDVVARFGGEEFVVLLPGTDTDEAAHLAERLRRTVEKHVFAVGNGVELRCTVSIGIASCPAHGTTLPVLMEQVDAAMYRAKRTRNAVARAEGQPVPAAPRLAGALVSSAASPLKVAAPPSPTPAPPAAPATPRSAGGPKPSRLMPVVLWTTVCVASVTVIWSLMTVATTSAWLVVAPLLVLAVAAELLKVNVYEADRQQRISFSFGTVVTMATVTINPAYAPLSELASDLVHVIVGRQRDPIKFLFNLANPTMSAAAAAGAYVLLRPAEEGFTPVHFAAALVAVLTYYVVNYGVLSLMISLASGQPLMLVLRGTLWYAPTKLFLGLTGAFLGAAHGEIGLFAAAMFAMPLLIMRFTLSFYASKTQRHIETLQAAKSEVEAAHHEKEEMLRKLIETVALIIDARDNSVSGHSRRVAKFAVAVGKEMRMGASELAVLHTAGLFHDLGKVGIPEAILHKPAKLTADEYTVIKEHAALGQRILSEVPQLADIATMVGQHHERYDGFGYPLGLAADQISLGGRILVVADALETMLADRPYSRGRELAEALAELDRCAGSHFDPDVVSAVHRAVATHGPEFFAGSERQAERNWGAAEQILAQVFA